MDGWNTIFLLVFKGELLDSGVCKYTNVYQLQSDD